MMKEFQYYNANDIKVNESDCFEFSKQLAATKDIKEKGDMLFKFWYENRGKHFQALEKIVNEVKKEAKIKGCNNTLGWCAFVIGWVELDAQNFTESHLAFQEAEKQFLKSDNKDGLARAINGFGITSLHMGHYKDALVKFSEALDIAEELGTDNLISAISNNISELFFNLKVYEDMAEFLSQALQREKEGTLNRALMQANLGKAYTILGELELAEENLRAAFIYFLQDKNKYFKTEVFYYTALLKLAQGKINEAGKIFKQTMKFAYDTNNQMHKGAALLELSLIDKDKPANIRCRMLLKALELFKELNSQDAQAKVLTALSEVYREMGDFPKAFQMSQKAIAMETHIYNDEMINKTGVFKAKQARKENKIYKRLYHQINHIAQIGQSLTSTLNSEEIGKIAFEHLTDLLEIDCLFIGLFVEGETNIIRRICIADDELYPSVIIPVKKGVFQMMQAIYAKGTVVIGDLSKDQDDFTKKLGEIFCPLGVVNSLICGPLNSKGQDLGILAVHARKKCDYLAHHIDMFSAISSYLAIALYNAKLFSEVDKLATLDLLTNLLNRRSILEQARKEFSTYCRYGNPFTIAMIDLDKFKFINDNYGHSVGDLVLQEFVNLLQGVVRKNDFVGRLGGDEFIIILPQTSIAQATIVGERLCQKVFAQKLLSQNETIQVSISIGLTEVLPFDKSISDVINRADTALYKAKEQGGNQVREISANIANIILT